MAALLKGHDRGVSREALDHFLWIDEVVVQVDDDGDARILGRHRDLDLGVVEEIRVEQDAGQVQFLRKKARHAEGPISSQGDADEERAGMGGDDAPQECLDLFVSALKRPVIGDEHIVFGREVFPDGLAATRPFGGGLLAVEENDGLFAVIHSGPREVLSVESIFRDVA